MLTARKSDRSAHHHLEANFCIIPGVRKLKDGATLACLDGYL